MPRITWCMYDNLNNSDHAKCAQIALNKLLPGMTGYRLTLVKVQQQEWIYDCGLFFCVFMELLTLGLDSSQYTFDQSLLRLKFRQILE